MNHDIGLSVLGPHPTYRQLFSLDPFVHEAPFYIPFQNWIIFSEFAYDAANQLQLNLNATLPTLSNSKPFLGISGKTFHSGLLYWAVSGSKSLSTDGNTTSGLTPGIYSVNPTTGVVSAVVNNYYGTYLNSPHDLVFDRERNFFFTGSIYGWQ